MASLFPDQKSLNCYFEASTNSIGSWEADSQTVENSTWIAGKEALCCLNVVRIYFVRTALDVNDQEFSIMLRLDHIT